jgi:hypothetical protein
MMPGQHDPVLSGGVGCPAREAGAPPPILTSEDHATEDALLVRLRVLYDGLRQEPIPDHLLALTLRLM